ncbi:2-keto-4-pentenoate hydratase [Nocardioides sp.]|uniref:2-keto-4-pentenoate hydratase n=1 Tax=Nocardioides sp. TaxID=35761 RepID=UPI0039E26D6C
MTPTNVPDTVTAAADRLRTAAATATPVEPVRDLIGRDDVAAAYAVQELLTRERVAAGARIVGRKIGLTSAAVQAQIGVDQPDFGVLFDDMAYADGDTIAYASVLQPRVEGEIAFVLAEDLVEGDLDAEQVRGAIGYAVAALEVCGSRVAGWDISFGDTVADNASAGVYVLGTERKGLAEFTPVDAAMTMTIDGEEVSTGSGAACLGDPIKAVVWLARKAREFGEPLRAGQVLLSGALGPMRPIPPGATVQATVTGLGSVSAHFSD